MKLEENSSEHSIFIEDIYCTGIFEMPSLKTAKHADKLF